VVWTGSRNCFGREFYAYNNNNNKNNNKNNMKEKNNKTKIQRIIL